MKRTLLILLGASLLIAFNLKAQTKYDDAIKAIKNKDYAAALKITKECLDMDSTGMALKILIQLREKDYKNDKKLFEYLGDTYAKMNVAELALTNYDQAEKFDSLDIALKFKSADLLVKEKRYTEAVNKYLKIVSLDPKNTKALLQAGTILFLAKMYADAGVVFEKYIALEQSEDAYQKTARAFIEVKNYEKACNYALEGLKIYPKNTALNKIAAVASFGLASNLVKDYQDCMKNATNDEMKKKCGKIQDESNRKFAESGKFYSAVSDSLLTLSDLKNAGKAFQLIGADSIAIKYFEKVIQKDSTQSGLFMDMADNYYRNNNFEKAIKYYSAKVKVNPQYELAYRNMGFVYFRMEKWDDARQAFSKAKELVDTTFATNYWLAQTYNQMDSTEQASDQYITILKLAEGKEKQYKNEVLEANGFLGQRAFIKKNYSAAINYTLKALQLKPNEWRFMEVLGASYHQLQNFDEAIRWYKATLKINPKSEVAKKGLRMLSAD